MVSFQRKFSAGMQARGIRVTYELDGEDYDSVLVVGGTRRLRALRRTQRLGIPIVQRLDGINWLHRQTRTGLKHWLRAEYGNRLLARIRGRLASGVVYQSEFVRQWWERSYPPSEAENRVIHNGVDLAWFSPKGVGDPPKDRVRILLVEGNLRGGYELGLESAVKLAEHLKDKEGLSTELMIAAEAPEKLQKEWSTRSRAPIRWQGLVAQEELPALYRSAHLLYSADLNAACPNSVLEAMACGLPVIAFDTGALNELVTPEAGRLAPYGGDPWRLDAPDIEALAEAALDALEEHGELRAGARARVEQAFGLDAMVKGYLDMLGLTDG